MIAIVLGCRGLADAHLPPYESEQLIPALRKAGKPLLANACPGEDHEFSKPEDHIDIWRHQQAFRRRHLQSPAGLSRTSIDEVDLNLPR